MRSMLQLHIKFLFLCRLNIVIKIGKWKKKINFKCIFKYSTMLVATNLESYIYGVSKITTLSFAQIEDVNELI